MYRRKLKSRKESLDRYNGHYLYYLSVAAHLRGMRPTPSTDKDFLKPNGKLKTLNTTNQTHN